MFDDVTLTHKMPIADMLMAMREMVYAMMLLMEMRAERWDDVSRCAPSRFEFTPTPFVYATPHLLMMFDAVYAMLFIYARRERFTLFDAAWGLRLLLMPPMFMVDGEQRRAIRARAPCITPLRRYMPPEIRRHMHAIFAAIHTAYGCLYDYTLEVYIDLLFYLRRHLRFVTPRQ